MCPYHIFILADPALSAISFINIAWRKSQCLAAQESICTCSGGLEGSFIRKRCALIFDGENQQLKAFRNPDIYNNLTFDSLLCIKLSCTQPLDAGMIFHNTKQAISDASDAADNNVIGSVVGRITDQHEIKVGHRVKCASQIVTRLPIVI